MGKILRIGLVAVFFSFLQPALRAQSDWFAKTFGDRQEEAGAKAKSSLVNIRYDANVICIGSQCELEIDHSAYGPGTDLRYSWIQMSDGTVLGESRTLSFSPSMESEYVLCAVVKDLGVEIGRDTLTVYVTHVPEYEAVSDTVCYGMEATVGVQGGRYWAWSTGGTTQYVNVRPGNTTYYGFRLSQYPIAEYGYENACYAEDSVAAVIFDSATFDVVGPTGACEGMRVEWEVIGGTDVSWNGNPGERTYSFVVEQDTEVRVTATDPYGCRDTRTLTVSVIDRPEGEILSYVDGEQTDTVCLGKEVRLDIYTEQADRFRWFTRDTAESITVSPRADFVAYCDIYVGESDQCSTRVSKQIFVKNCSRIYFPTGFVLDGFTKTFGPIGIEDSTRTYFFAVFNRNGEMVFSTTDFSQGWDGKHKGKWVVPGVYVYVFKETFEQFVWTKKGTVTVIR